MSPLCMSQRIHNHFLMQFRHSSLSKTYQHAHCLDTTSWSCLGIGEHAHRTSHTQSMLQHLVKAIYLVSCLCCCSSSLSLHWRLHHLLHLKGMQPIQKLKSSSVVDLSFCVTLNKRKYVTWSFKPSAIPEFMGHQYSFCAVQSIHCLAVMLADLLPT